MTIDKPRVRLRKGALVATSALMLVTVAACGDDDDDAGTGGGGDGGGESTVDTYETNADAFDALSAGRVDAVALTSFTIALEVEEIEGFESTEPFIPEIDGEEQIGCGAFGFRYEDAPLRNAFNAELAAMQEADEVLPIVEPFGFTEEAVTTATEHTANELAGGAYDDIDGTEGEIPEVSDAELQPYRDSGVVIGIAPEPPYGYEEDGEATGEGPELAREIFDRLGVEVRDYAVSDFGALVDGLNADRMDVISAGMFINPERAEQVLFANPDYCATTAFAVPEGNPDEITDLQSALDADITIGVIAGTVEKDYLETLQGAG